MIHAINETMAKEMVATRNDRVEIEKKSLFKEKFGNRDNISASEYLSYLIAYDHSEIYKLSKAVLELLRNDGWDIKMDMQNYKLVFYGEI